MELSHLKYFYEVAKQGSFSKASKELRISQPSISKMVKQLEYQEGYTFLDRQKKGVRLTPMGKILFEKCEAIFAEFADLKRTLSNRKEECQGELWVGASDNLCNYVLPPLFASFLNRFPMVQLKLFAGVAPAIVQQLKDFHLELGLFYTQVKDASLNVEELFQVEFIPVVSPTLIKNTRSSKITVKNLKTAVYVGSRALDYERPYPALQMLRLLGLEPVRYVESNHQETQKRLVEAGVGYSLLPEHMVRSAIVKGDLVRVEAPRKVRYPVFLVRRRNRTLSNVALRWCESLQEALSARAKN